MRASELKRRARFADAPTAVTIRHRHVIFNPDLRSPRPPPAGHRAWKRRPPLGLGDLVERIAKPVARLIDRGTGRTRLAGCSACSGRRCRWNALLPDIGDYRAYARLLARAGRRVSRWLYDITGG